MKQAQHIPNPQVSEFYGVEVAIERRVACSTIAEVILLITKLFGSRPRVVGRGGEMGQEQSFALLLGIGDRLSNVRLQLRFRVPEV